MPRSISGEDSRIVPFRPRRKPGPSPAGFANHPGDSEADDYRRRMIANAAGFAVAVALTASGIWLAVTLAELRKAQDCVLVGRRDCGLHHLDTHRSEAGPAAFLALLRPAAPLNSPALSDIRTE